MECIRACQEKILQEILGNKEPYKKELQAKIDYDMHLAEMAEKSGEPSMTLRHRKLTDIYQGAFE